MPVTSYSTVSGNNNAAPPNGSPEGQSPGSLNNVIRQIMADVAVEAQTNAVKVLKSVAGTNTITADMDPELGAYAAGMIVVLTPANNNTGATTLNIDGLGALDVQKQDGDALIADDLVAGIPALLVLDSGADDWLLMNPQTVYSAVASLQSGVASLQSGVASGSFTGTLATGLTTTPTGTVYYKISNGMCTLYTEADITGTAAGGGGGLVMTMTGVDAAARPSATRIVPCMNFILNGNNYYSGRAAIASSGTITFGASGVAAAPGMLETADISFSVGGTKGIAAGWSITYPL
jgi:hypothetical protein